jgi:3'(2'), 5'-bisphosphate nucleotidase
VPTFDFAAAADILEALTTISMSAAAAILTSRGPSGVRSKADGSPVTAADQAAETVIRDRLAHLAPAVPIISEEEAERQLPTVGSPSYFLVDPLDGTREYVAGLDEYTINIGLISAGSPMLGIITAPALGLIWRGIVGHGAERLAFSSQTTSRPEAIQTRSRPQPQLVVMVSRSHLDAATQAYVDNLPDTRRAACGSSLKFCRLAEGTADHYPRLGPTRDWDVAAGHAILAAAGGCVIDPDGAALNYGTPNLLIPSFLAWGSPAPAAEALKTGR